MAFTWDGISVLCFAFTVLDWSLDPAFMDTGQAGTVRQAGVRLGSEPSRENSKKVNRNLGLSADLPSVGRCWVVVFPALSWVFLI